MKYTNINIISPFGPMKHYFEYIDDESLAQKERTGICYIAYKDNLKIDFYDENVNLRRNNNEWYEDDFDLFSKDLSEEAKIYLRNKGIIVSLFDEDYIPDLYNTSLLNVYFPRFSANTYLNNIKYAISVSTYIHGHQILLGEYLVDRNNALAPDQIKKFGNEEYYEYIPLRIIDPWNLIYGNEWKRFRQVICGETSQGIAELNSTGSILNITIHPVMDRDNMIHPLTQFPDSIGKLVKVYREISNFEGGQNSINIGDSISDYLHLSISCNQNESSYYESRLLINTDIKFNTAYDQDKYGLREYIKETYNVDEYQLSYEITMFDQDSIYAYIEKIYDDPWQDIELKMLVDEWGHRPFVFDGWIGYKTGMNIRCLLHITPIFNGQLCDDDLIVLQSNNIPVTPELFRYMVHDEYVFNRIQKHLDDDPHIEFGGKPIEILEDIVSIDGDIITPDENNQILYNDAIFEVHDREHYVTYEGVELYIDKEKVVYGEDTYTEGNFTIGEKDPLYIETMEDGFYLRTSEPDPKLLEVHDGHVWYDGVDQPYNDADFVWLKDRYRFDGINHEGYTTLNDQKITIQYGKIYYMGKEVPVLEGKLYIDKCPINKVYLEAVDMKVYNINAVNKVQQTIVQVERPDSYKSNIVKPIFFRARQLSNLVLHPAVTEHIALNLDAYKSKVDTFILQINGVSIPETARTSSGVTFKIPAGSISTDLTSTTYYILNQNNELITTGKFTIEI